MMKLWDREGHIYKKNWKNMSLEIFTNKCYAVMLVH